LASMFVERRLFSESMDEVSLVLLASEETNNVLDYPNVSVFERGFGPADWDLVTFLREHVQGTGVEADWLDSVIVALDLLRTAQEERDPKKKFSALRIFMFSELGCPSNTDQLDLVMNGIKMIDNLEFTFIGPDWKTEEEEKENTEDENDDDGPSTSKGEPSKLTRKKLYPSKSISRVQATNGLIVDQLVEATEGHTSTLDEALEAMLFKQKKVKKPWPWKVCFSLGPDIKINTTGFIMTRRENPKQWKRCLAKGGEEELKPVTTYVRVPADDDEEEEEVASDDIVMGYRYGAEIVTISEEDEQMTKFEGGPKSLSLFGFLPCSEVKHHQVLGDGCMVFLPSEGDSNSGRAWAALTQAMLQLKVVAVVRKVYNKNSAPRLGALVPEYSEEGDLMLVHVELPFAEDLRYMEFPSLPAVSEEQTELMDDLVEQMMLSNDTADVFPVEQILNPSHQNMFHALTHRALRPGEMLPGPSQHVVASVSPPEEILRCAEPLLLRMKEIFKTKLKEDPRKRKQSEGEEGGGEADSKKRRREEAEEETEVTHVGRVSPSEDFRYLLAHSVTSGTNLTILSQQLETVLLNLLASPFSSSLTTKIISGLAAHREETGARQRPELYNDLIRRVKVVMSEHGKQKMWLEVVEANLGLIAHSEVAGGAEEAEAHQFLLPPEDKEQDDEDSDDVLANL